MVLLEILSNVICLFGSSFVILSIIIFGLYWVDRKFFTLMLLFLLLNITFNALLKNIWQVPLNPSLGKEGWAFPSGHMQFTALLYLTMSVYFRSWYGYMISGLILSGLALSMHFLGYHTWLDMIAALGFATMFITILFSIKDGFNKYPCFISIILLILQSLMTLFITAYNYDISAESSRWLRTIIGLAAGVVCGLLLYTRDSNNVISSKYQMTLKIKIYKTIFALSALLISNYLINFYKINSNIALFSISLSCGVWLSYFSYKVFRLRNI